MNGFELYKMMLALQQHFDHQSNYDYFRYNGKVNAKLATFEAKRDRYFYEKMAKKYSQEELQDFLVSNLCEGNKIWIGDLNSEKAQSIYVEWKKRQESLTYLFKEDIRTIKDYCTESNIEIEKMFSFINSEYPPIVHLLMKKKIMKETAIILEKLSPFIDRWEKKISNEGDIILEMIVNNLKKYRPFVRISDNKKYAKIAVDILKS